ncbi:hypothetical protein BDZ89DRAFT_1136205 [Hymenopellis radicata]|nr:hypothetical protein BDZ89DRAFT_1136205 [Hymenopellis radicata]
MSRRESRVSMGARQTDSVFEYDNFKKKFLAQNRQIAKLNSTLSLRVKELSAEIAQLFNENIRLRESEIALAAELKREREKSRKVLYDAEMAALNLTKHLGFVRETFNIRHTSDTPSPTPPRATHRPLTSTPPSPRLSREPTVPGINEEEEPPDSPHRSKKTKRLSASRLPLPSRCSPSPPPLIDLAPPKKKKSSSRRQSGLFPVNIPVVDELAVTTAVALEDDDDPEEVAVFDDLVEEPAPIAKKEKRRKKEGTDAKFKDLTNEPRRKSPPIDDIPPTRQFLTPSPPQPTSLPTPQTSSSPEPTDAERTRRARKTVNYAEPKLNTKMRRADGVPPLRKQRMSASAVLDDRKVTLKRNKKFDYPSEEDPDDEDGADGDADEDYAIPSWRMGDRRHSLAI